MKNNRGFTLLELIIALALMSVTVLFMYKIILDVKYERDNAGYAVKNQINRAEIIKLIYNDILTLGVCSIESNNKINYCDSSKKSFSVDSDRKIFSYGNRKWEISDKNYKYGTPSFTNAGTTPELYLLTIPVVNLQGENESTIDDILITFTIRQ